MSTAAYARMPSRFFTRFIPFFRSTPFSTQRKRLLSRRNLSNASSPTLEPQAPLTQLGHGANSNRGARKKQLNEGSSVSICLEAALRLLHDLGFAFRAHDAHRTFAARNREDLPTPFAPEVFRGLAIHVHGVEHISPTLWLRRCRQPLLVLFFSCRDIFRIAAHATYDEQDKRYP